LFSFNPIPNESITSPTDYCGINIELDYDSSNDSTYLSNYAISVTSTAKSNAYNINCLSSAKFVTKQEAGANPVGFLSGLIADCFTYGSTPQVYSISGISYLFNEAAQTNIINSNYMFCGEAIAYSWISNSIIELSNNYGLYLDVGGISKSYSGCQVSINNNYGACISVSGYSGELGSTTIDNNYGICIINEVFGNTGNSVITNHYGIHLDSFANATNEWGIYAPSATAKHLLAGETRVAYDVTHYASFTVSSAGNLTLTDTGTTIYTDKIIENTVNGEGIILKSPDGTRYKLTVTNGGTLSITAA